MDDFDNFNVLTKNLTNCLRAKGIQISTENFLAVVKIDLLILIDQDNFGIKDGIQSAIGKKFVFFFKLKFNS